MARFEAALRRAEAALDLPPQKRARILVEMEGDLDALFEAYRARGLTEQEAAARAAAALGLGRDAAHELTRLHKPPYLRWTARMSDHARSTAERWFVTVMFVAVLGYGVVGLAPRTGGAGAAPLSWLIVVLGASVAAANVWLAIRLYLEQDPRDSTMLLGAVAWLGAAAPVVALIAVVGELDGLAQEVVAAGAWTVSAVAPGVRRATHVFALGTMVAMATYLAWFHLRRRLETLTRAEAELAAIAHQQEGGR